MISLEKVRQRAELDAKTHGYHLTPDPELLRDLLEGLWENEKRYGYPSCPCRMATGYFEIDRDIICPCDYRDPDVMEHGACYCCLYVDNKTYESKEIKPIPDRRPMAKQLKAYDTIVEEPIETERARLETDRKLWYCKQCGYIVFREEPPYVCPICRAKREMFARLVSVNPAMV